jgi:hypothetical protein
MLLQRNLEADRRVQDCEAATGANTAECCHAKGEFEGLKLPEVIDR